MFAPPPPPAAVSIPASAPLTLESAFALARFSARRVSAPDSVLASDAPVADKLAAIDAIHSQIPDEPKAGKVAALDALTAAASSASQPPEVRAKALTFAGYAMNQVDDDAARSRALTVILAALKLPPYRIFALRGLGPAAHGTPKADEPRYQAALLDLLDGDVAGEERETALVALFSFISTREDLAKRAPALVSELDRRLLGPIEADPARFVADPRFTPGARAMAAAIVWSSARHREQLGRPAAGARVHALLVKLAALETDETTLGWLKTYRDAAPGKSSKPQPKPKTRRRGGDA
ncbi:MAG TPA: hypothetical protein VN915_03860 [Elusimicrobiota bacterium]|nr:hypothetical protein [Elusimicrobiota bacterium]